MDSAETVLHSLSALVLAGFALVVLAGRPRRRESILLSVFLLLIAGNQGAEAMRTLAADAHDEVVWFRIASIFASLDPAVLLLFGATQSGAARIARGSVAAAALAPSALLALYAGWMLDLPTDAATAHPYSVVLSLYTAGIYVAVFLWLARRSFGQDTPDGWVWLLPPVGLVSLFALPRVIETFYLLLWGYDNHPTWLPELLLANVFLVLAGAAAAFYAWARRHPLAAETREVVVWTLTGSLAIVALFQVYRFSSYLDALGLSPGHDALLMVGKTGAAIRWIFFGAFVSIAALRHDALGLNLQARRRAARMLVALMLLSAGVLLVTFGPSWLREGAQELPLLAFVLLGAALVVSQGFRSLVDSVASRAYGVPMPADVQARHEIYRSAVAAAIAVGRNPMRDRELAVLRDELGLDSRAASVLEQLADASTTGPIQPGQLVGQRYLVERVLGRGGTGRIFLAHDELLNRAVAIKEVFHDEGEGEALLHEARVAGAIEHPNVVRVYDALARPGTSLLVEEHVAGGSLEERVRAQGPLHVTEAIPLVEGILEGLAEVHRHGVIHRDLKPDNILLDEAGRPKIADFGVASQRGIQTVAYGRGPVGTPGFMAPEQALGLPATPASDHYALGRLVERCVSPPLPEPLAAVVRKALRPVPEERWSDAREMLRAWRSAAAAVAAAAPRSDSG